MKKNKKLLIIVIICAVVLAGALLLLLFLPKGDSGDPNDGIDYGTDITATVDEAGVHQASLVLNDKGELENNSYGTLLEYVPRDISKIEVENTSGSYEITSYTPTVTDDEGQELTDTTVYTLVGFENLELQSGIADSIASNVAALDFTSVASVDGANSGDFGFDSSRATATVTYADGTKAIIIVGDEAAAGAGTYVRFGSGEPIYLVSDDSVSALLYSVNDLISLTVNSAAESNDDSTASKVTLSGTNFPETVVFETNEDESCSVQYVITKPEKLFADDNETSLVTGAIRGVYADSVAYANPSENQIKQCGLDKPYACVKAEYPDATVELMASKPDESGNVYLMAAGGKVIYTKASANLPWVVTSYEDLISSYVLNPSFTAVSSVTVNDGKKDYEFKLSSETSTSTDDDGNETTATTTTVKYGKKVLSQDNFNVFFKNIAYIERADNTSPDPDGEPIMTVTYKYSAKDSADTVCFYEGTTGKCIAVLNGRTVGTVYKSRVTGVLSQIDTVIQDEIIDTLS